MTDIRAAIKDDAAFDGLFSSVHYDVCNNQSVLSTTSPLICQLLGNYLDLIKNTCSKYELPSEVRFVVSESDAPTQPVSTPQVPSNINTGLNPRYQFDNFVVADSNKFAYVNAFQMVDATDRRSNSLFIYGASGVGKTHLMHAIGNTYLQHNPNARVLCVTCDQFLNDYIDSIRVKTTQSFRDMYRTVNLLMVDDIQGLAGKSETQMELFNVFNSLYDNNNKIVFTSDRPPKDLDILTERLRQRLGWGVTVDIQTPELETRITILIQKAEREGFNLQREVATFIAENIVSNVRELEGALTTLISYSHAMNQPDIGVEQTKKILSSIIGDSKSTCDIDANSIIDIVCDEFSISVKDIIGSSRLKKYAEPRHLAQYLIRELTGLTFPKIAEIFGGRNHSSVLHACRKITKEIDTDENLKYVVHNLIRKIKECKI